MRPSPDGRWPTRQRVRSQSGIGRSGGAGGRLRGGRPERSIAISAGPGVSAATREAEVRAPSRAMREQARPTGEKAAIMDHTRIIEGDRGRDHGATTWVYTSHAPSRFETKVTPRPSGVQEGKESSAGWRDRLTGSR